MDADGDKGTRTMNEDNDEIRLARPGTNIIHAGIYNGSISMYACNSMCGFFPHKIDFTWKHVTCKRCLNLIKKYDRSEEDGYILFKDKEVKTNG
jgi:hypothetical protein